MKNVFCLLAAACLSLPLFADDAYSLSSDADTSDKTSHVVELRQSAGAGFNLGKQWTVGLCEDIREVVYDSGNTPSAYFSKSYTTVDFGWKALSITDPYNNYKYGLKLHAGYTLRYLHPKQAIRHRPFVTLNGSVNFGPVKLSLRERFLVDCRTDSVNPLEQAKYAMELRHRLTADFTIPGKTYKPFTFIEFANTLNAPSYTNPTTNTLIYGGQYLCAVRAKVGLRWKMDMNNSLTFEYGFHFTQQREVNIREKKGDINRLYMDKTCRHVITVAYEFGM